METAFPLLKHKRTQDFKMKGVHAVGGSGQGSLRVGSLQRGLGANPG